MFCDKPLRDKPLEDYSTLHRGPRQGLVTEGPRQRFVTEGGGPATTRVLIHSHMCVYVCVAHVYLYLYIFLYGHTNVYLDPIYIHIGVCVFISKMLTTEDRPQAAEVISDSPRRSDRAQLFTPHPKGSASRPSVPGQELRDLGLCPVSGSGDGKTWT